MSAAGGGCLCGSHVAYLIELNALKCINGHIWYGRRILSDVENAEQVMKLQKYIQALTEKNTELAQVIKGIRQGDGRQLCVECKQPFTPEHHKTIMCSEECRINRNRRRSLERYYQNVPK